MKTLWLGVGLVIAASALAFLIAPLAGVTRASDGGEGPPPTGAPHIGVTVSTLSEADAAALGLEGGARVERARVNALLRQGDVIVEIDDIEVTTARRVARIVHAATPGDVLNVTVVREGLTLDVQVPVAGRKAGPVKRHKPAAGFTDSHMGLLRALASKVVSGEVDLKTNRGIVTVRGVVGELVEVNVVDRVITLSPAGGSGPITFEIEDRTIVVTGAIGDIGALNTNDKTLVLTVTDDQGERTALVIQTDRLFESRFSQPGHAMDLFKALFSQGGTQ